MATEPSELAEVVSVSLDEQGVRIRVKWQRSGAEWTLNESADSVLATYVRNAAATAVGHQFDYLTRTGVTTEEAPPTS
jgi:hypothetical protein